MTTLLDTIQQNRQQLAGQPVPFTDETGKLRKLQQGLQGRGNVGPEFASVNQAELAANDAANQQAQQLQQQSSIQTSGENVQAAGQKQQEEQAVSDIQQKQKFNTVQNQMQTNQILSELGRDKASLDLDKDRAKLEQAAFGLAMQDKQYTDQLQDVGRKNRLDNDANFRKEMEEAAFGNKKDILVQALKNRDILSTTDRDFQKAMANMSVDQAKQIADIEIAGAKSASDININNYRQTTQDQARAANTQQMIQGAGQVATSGITAYGDYSAGKYDSGYQDYLSGQKGVSSYDKWRLEQDALSKKEGVPGFVGPTRAQKAGVE